MAVKAVVLDWDGTTLYSWPQAQRIIREIFYEFGCPNDAKRVLAIRERWGYAITESFHSAMPEADRETLSTAWANKLRAATDSETMKFIPRALETIEALLNLNLVCTLLTNRKAKHLADNLPASIDLAHAFSIVQTYYDAKRPR